MSDKHWDLIFKTYAIDQHDFSQIPFTITADQIKAAAKAEPRLLCKHDSREARPSVFVANNLFILPIKNGIYSIIQGEGYIDIPPITSPLVSYSSQLPFQLLSAGVGDSEMQHLDFAYAASLIRSYLNDASLVLTIRGRKYTPAFDFIAGQHQQRVSVQSVQTEVDAGYEGQNQIVLIEAKNTKSTNVIIRQLFYPFCQWRMATSNSKAVRTLFFEKRGDEYHIWEFGFQNPDDYNSIHLINSQKYKIV